MFRPITKVLAAGVASVAAYLYTTPRNNEAAVVEANEGLRPPTYPWSHELPWQAYDIRSVRRGHKVYTQVCSTCHSLEYVFYRHLVNTVFSEEEVLAILADAPEVKDGPNDDGDMYDRPAKLTDRFPSPYENDKAAAAANGGAIPPDLSLIVKAREDHEDYVFKLLTGYRGAPSGVQPKEGLHYNPYFPGGFIAMAQALNDGQVEYEDGTPNSQSQMAKDVSTFLAWAAEPTQDERKRLGFKIMLCCALMGPPALYWKRFKWQVIKGRQLVFKDPKH